jgi:uncharacterized membrane protein YfcA
VDACTSSLALGIGAFILVLAGAVFASAAPAAGLALMVAGMLTYAAARARLSKC